jgi:ADP-ribose pyrophosphatase YjhB (NUDIX family)
MTTLDTTRTMITFEGPQHRFTYRIGGIFIHNGHILCQKSTLNPQDPYWFLPGGRAELGESAIETLQREMREELDEDVQVKRLLYLVENFYTDTVHHHELSLYFEIAFAPNSYLYQNKNTIQRPDEDEQPMIFEWLPLTDLPKKMCLRPHLLCQELQQLPEQTKHIIHVGNTNH